MSEAELNALESALRGLTPSAQPLDRDWTMFRAGRASAARYGWLWPLATAASTLVAVGLGIAWWAQSPRVKTVEHVVQVPPPPPAPEPAPQVEPTTPERPGASPLASVQEPPATRYEQLQENLLRWGLDGLPPSPRTRHGSVSANDLLHPF
jgi:hypothetical protein